jgi:hypothetical protein
MTKTLETAAKELKSQIDKIEKARIDLPEELFMKSVAVQNLKKHWCSTHVDRTDPSYFQDKFGERLDGGYGQSM